MFVGILVVPSISLKYKNVGFFDSPIKFEQKERGLQ